MSFRFNFLLPQDSEIPEHTNVVSDEVIVKDEGHECLGLCGFLTVGNISSENANEISMLIIGDLEIQYVLVKSLELKTENETFSCIVAQKTDLIPGKYEGGLKIWECSVDLAIYLAENKCIKNEDTVLELGCGAGIPALVAYLNGAKVTFQDFNPEVLEFVTLPNTILNTPKDKQSSLPDVCQYLYGDWGSIHKKYYADSAVSTKYDVILTSETIYEKSSFMKLLELMKAALKPDGVIYLAAKIHYFGVGGGITDFEKLVQEDETFEISTVLRIKQGVERQILRMKFIK